MIHCHNPNNNHWRVYIWIQSETFSRPRIMEMMLFFRNCCLRIEYSDIFWLIIHICVFYDFLDTAIRVLTLHFDDQKLFI